MRHQRLKSVHYFFTTAPLPCPYLPDRMERRIVTELAGRDVDALHDALSLSGFRRSHGIAYATACPACNACIPIRVVCADHTPSRTHRRIERANSDLVWEECPAQATEEQYALFAYYQMGRHGDGEMAKMDFEDYQALVEDTPIETKVIEFRSTDEKLVAVCLVDWVCDGLSAVYSFFDPDLDRRSLGTYMVTWLIGRAHELGLRYVYMGFWIEACGKMSYKSKFQPYEILRNGEWLPGDGVRPDPQMALPGIME